jgi:tetratricopeptide (TPR) repeat protein
MSEYIQTLRALKEKGEIASERGNQDEALSFLDQAFVMALKHNNYAEAINVLGHHLHVHKALYKETQNDDFMELFRYDCQIGLTLAERNNIQGQPVSVMYLRLGDYFLFKKDYGAAVENYSQALAKLNQVSQEAEETVAEYLGHLASAQVKNGQTEEGLGNYQQALKMIESNQKLRPFHRDIIHCGLLLRYSQSLYELGRTDDAKEVLPQAEVIAGRLAQEHGMSARKKQVEEAKKILGI